MLAPGRYGCYMRCRTCCFVVAMHGANTARLSGRRTRVCLKTVFEALCSRTTAISGWQP